MVKRIVVLTFEGLATSPLGAYGCSWLETPGVDSVSAAGVVFDRMYACSTDPLVVLRRYLSFDGSPTSVPKLGSLLGFTTLFFTDSPAAAELAASLDFEHCTLVQSATDAGPAMDVEETSLGQLFAAATAGQESLGETPYLLWIHSSALVTAWDAPLEMRESEDLISGDDGDADETISAEVLAALNATLPPQQNLSDTDDPDLLLAWMAAYGAQIGLIDALLDVAFAEFGTRQGECLIIGSTGGFTLGEHGWLGTQHHSPMSSRLHLPLIIRAPELAPLRCNKPVLSCRLSTTLADWIQDANCLSADSLLEELLPERWATANEATEPIFEIVDDLRHPSGALTTYRVSSGWFYISNPDGREELYLKPDDRYDINDVAKLSPDVIERFRAWP